MCVCERNVGGIEGGGRRGVRSRLARYVVGLQWGPEVRFVVNLMLVLMVVRAESIVS